MTKSEYLKLRVGQKLRSRAGRVQEIVEITDVPRYGYRWVVLRKVSGDGETHLLFSDMRTRGFELVGKRRPRVPGIRCGAG